MHKDLLRDIKFLDQEIRELEHAADNSDYSATKIEQLKKKREKELAILISKIENIDSARHRVALLKYYVNKKSVKRIAREMHYSVGYIHRLIDEGAELIK